MSYFPLDRDLLTSTLWIEGDSDTKALWIYLLLSADPRTGIVKHTRPAIAHGSGVPRAEVNRILEQFAAPDPDSRTPDDEGRRIAFVEDGILILNYDRYKNRDYSTPRAKRYDERNPGRKHRKDKRATGGNGGQRSATTNTNTNTNLKEQQDFSAPDRRVGSDSEKVSVPKQIAELEVRYRSDLVVEARKSCALSRKYGKMTDSVWLKILEQLSKHPKEAVEEGIRIYIEEHADGEKREEYLLGIVRRLARKKPESRKTRSSDPLDAEFKENQDKLNSGTVTENERRDLTTRQAEIAAIKQGGRRTPNKATLTAVAGGGQ